MTPIHTTASAALWTCALAAITLYNGPTVLMGPTDVFVQLHAAWSMLDGQIPHRDFSNPIGVLTYALVAAGMRIAGLGLDGLMWGSVMFLTVSSIWTGIVSFSRLKPVLACVVTMFLTTMVVATRPLGYAPQIHSYAMSYNRYGWVLLCVLFVQTFVAPSCSKRASERADAVSLGLLLGCLLYTKISYFIVGACALGVGASQRQPLRAQLAWSAAAFAAVCIGFRLFTGVSLVDYSRDLAMAGAAQSIQVRFVQLLHSARASIWSACGLLVAWIVVVGREAWQSRHLSTEARTITFKVVVICAGGLGIAAGNTGENAEVPAYAIAALVLLDWRLRTSHTRRDLPTWLLGVVTAALVGFIAARDVVSIIDTAEWRDYRIAKAPLSQRLDAPVLSQFVVPGSAQHATQFWRANQLPAHINEGLSLARANTDASSRLFVLALTNPFSFALGLHPARGLPLWWDAGHSYSRDIRPEADKLFADVNVVMIPILKPQDDGCCKEVVEDLMSFYGEYMATHFREAARSESWVLLKSR